MKTLLAKLNNDKRRSPANGSNTSSVGGVTSLILPALLFITICGIVLQCNTTNTYATPATLSLSISESNITAHAATNSASGSFVKSSSSTITASTNNVTGYKLMLASTNHNGTSDSDYNKLINPNDNDTTTNHLSSIDTNVTETAFSADTVEAGTNYNGKWGYYSSMYNSVDNTNTEYYYPAPATTGDILNETACANGTTNCPNNTDTYELAIGARVDASTKLGSYSNTFVVYLVAQAVSYSLTYVDNVVGSMPVDVASGLAEGSTVIISDSIPTRPGYTFIGWCTVVPTTNANGTDTCTGTEVVAGGILNMDQVGGNNNFTLYAMWGGNYTIGSVSTMQEFKTMSAERKAKIISSMEVGAQYQLTDNRDNTKYWIAKQADGNVWMTQNLDLCIGCTNVAALTSDNTDINRYGSGIYLTDYSMDKGVITWAPTTTANASPITSAQVINHSDNSVAWSPNNSRVYPWSAEAGDIYYYTSNTNANDITSTTCNNDDNVTDYCKHYHAGNYYNWPAAIASSDASYIDAKYAIADNSICPAGWRLPRGLSNATSTAYSREFGQLLYTSGVTTKLTSDGAHYTTDSPNGFALMRSDPLFFIRSGYVWTTSGQSAQHYVAQYGRYWSSTASGSAGAYPLRFTKSDIYSAFDDSDRGGGISLRCVVR